jgi:preprotein translocase subunit SecD
MPRKFVMRFFVVLAIVLFALYIAVPNQFPIGNQYFEKKGPEVLVKELVLGLDLVGGSHLAFDIDTTSVEADSKTDALESLKTTIEKRVNLFGVSEPYIALSEFEGKNKIIVELPGITDTAQAIELVGQTAQLNFAEVVIPEEESETPPEPQLFPTELTGRDLKKAFVNFDQTTGAAMVAIEFTDDGAKKFEDLTAKNIGKPLAILLDSQVVSAPVVNEKISGGSAVIQGQFTLDEAKALSVQLNAGALPLPINLIEERTIGATLGNESVKKSVEAGLIGVVMVMVFMIIAYRKLGIVADIGLIIFGVITLALYKFIPVVLTLPGIAGFLLTMGMAVDANILIFERFKEEKKIRHNEADAMENAFGRAWDSIRDANVATLIIAFILANPLDWPFLQTSGPVRGFAITLALGVLVSLFTGIYVSRNLLRLVVRGKQK